MKPETLVMRNIGPFKGRHSVDFTALGEIFLVYGKTGAGKTTIFDAIAYAFYGDAPGGRKGLVRQMRSQFAPDDEESAVELVFSLSGRRYRIRRVLPGERVGKRSGKVQQTAEETSLEAFETGVWKSLTSTNKSETDGKILSLIGLSEEEFTRIVLLPQGEFSRFLKQNSTERKQILSKLFPVGIYSRVIETARVKARDAASRLNDTETALLALRERFNPLAQDNDRKEILGEISGLKESQAALRRELSEKTTLLEKARAAAAKREQRARTAERLSILEERAAVMNASLERISAARRAEPLLVHSRQIESLRAQESALSSDLASLRDQLAGEREELSGLETKSAEIAGLQREKESQLLRKEQLRIAEGIAKTLSADLERYLESDGRRRSLRAKLASLERDARLSAPRLAELEGEASALEARSRDNASSREALERARRLKALSDDYERERLAIAGHEGALALSRERKERNAGDLRIAKAELTELERLSGEERDASLASSLAGGLREGVPCPVCGSLNHPSPAKPRAIDGISLAQRLEAGARRIVELEERNTTLAAEAAGHEANLATARDRLKALIAGYCEAIGSGDGRKDGTSADTAPSATDGQCISPTSIPDAAEAVARLKDASARMQDASDALTRSQKAFRESEEIRRKKAQAETGLTAVTAEISELDRLCAEQEASIKGKRERYMEAFPRDASETRGATGHIGSAGGTAKDDFANDIEGEAASEALELCSARILAIEAELSSHEDRLKRTRGAIAGLTGKIEALEKSRAELADSAERAGRGFAADCAAAGFADAAAVASAALSADEREDLEREIAEWNRDLTAARSLLAELDRELGAWQGPEVESIESEVSALDERMAETDRKLEERNAALAGLDSLGKQWDTLERERAERSILAGRLASLSGDLSGSNPAKISFDAWILGMYLEEITGYANTRLERMSDGRYRIQLNESYRKGNSLSGLELEILDAYTGKARPSGTLSGGETFMTSISLALGLADSIQARSGGIQLDAVFIDEGFGSLDESSLERAITILDEIRGHRMVGIISHVAELRSRIPNRVEVIKQADGSAIRKD